MKGLDKRTVNRNRQCAYREVIIESEGMERRIEIYICLQLQLQSLFQFFSFNHDQNITLTALKTYNTEDITVEIQSSFKSLRPTVYSKPDQIWPDLKLMSNKQNNRLRCTSKNSKTN